MFRDCAGLTPIRLHDLWHTYATLALKAGVHAKIDRSVTRLSSSRWTCTRT